MDRMKYEVAPTAAIRVGTKVRVLDTGSHGVVIWRRAKEWVHLRIDDHQEPFGPTGKGWFFPTTAIERIEQ